MKAKPLKLEIDSEGKHSYHESTIDDATHVQLEMPGPFPTRILPITSASSIHWIWNRDVERPTLIPSILTKCPTLKGEIVCHSFISNGMVQFLGDCTHQHAGKTVELLEVR